MKDSESAGNARARDYGLSPYIASPGLILGPYESLLALIMWMAELVAASNQRVDPWQGRLQFAGRVAAQYRSRLLRSLLLFGRFDAMAGMPLFDTYLLARGGVKWAIAPPSFARWQTVEELADRRYSRFSPFAHDLGSGGLIITLASMLPGDLEVKRLVPAVARGLRRAGYQISRDGMGEIEEALRGASQLVALDGKIAHPPTWATCAVAMIERSIDSGLPLFSMDAAAPAWISPISAVRKIEILRVVWEEVSWLPRPTSFREAASMAADDRMQSLRNKIDLWNHRISVGDITDAEDLKRSIRREVEYFRRKSWAERVNQFISYTAIPVAVAETIVDSVPLGVGIAAVGTGMQWIADLVDRAKQRSWVSLGRDF